MTKFFKNDPLTDFTVAANRNAFAKALADADTIIKGQKYTAHPIINGESLSTRRVEDRNDPSDPSILVGRIHYAGEKETRDAVAVLRKGWPKWESTPVQKRAAMLRAIGEKMLAEKFQLSALIVREAGKPWKEADADVAEAVDFCLYYADHMERLASPQPTSDTPGEDNHYFYQSRGLVVVIAPWNFPLAIACGMAVAALVAGNTVILKPAEQTSLIAYRFAQMVHEAGVPGDAFAFLPGQGEEIGRLLVNHPDVDMICFTGSKAVGLEIINSAAKVQPGQRNIKKVVAELGGKNAIIVDEDADLDEAVKGILYSSFGFSGQKCSACSRVIAAGTAYAPLVERLAEAAGDVIIGAAADPATLVGPVIDEESMKRIKGMIEKGKSEGPIAYEGTPPPSVPAGAYFVAPAIFKDTSADSSVWKEEIFGPVVACRKANDLSEALQLANDSQYALTGGFFSRSPSAIERARKEFRVGNLYINRGCTGAMVGKQPFGGFKMSGIGSKAGGPDYLLQFLEPRCVTENTMRRGFAPENPEGA